ncbi:hypothetical protein ACIQVR_39410 [Streptomyces xanthochromogenes]|uniref:hypothetical protein n=1 Tax=Streptomyces xanthochromogenes TaxID=67384 RepID=UPI00380B35A6
MTDQPTLRDRIRRAICEASGFTWLPDELMEPDEYGDHADAVLAVLPARVDRASDVDRLQARVLELEAELATVRDLLRAENKRANDAIDREDAAEQAALESPADWAAVLAEVGQMVRKEIRDCGYRQEDGCDFCNGVTTVLEKIRRMADEAQQPEEAWPSESQWRVEIYDPSAGQWMPAGTLTTKPEAERRLALAAERAPKWRDDGTDVRRRIVRTTVTYTVEPEEVGR